MDIVSFGFMMALMLSAMFGVLYFAWSAPDIMEHWAKHRQR